ncbi:MAG: phosphoglucosamine mutase [Melioribacteraceae bacterium]|nr:phosphoglucosamine mutase [Melioribacteraceae bacterium]
MPVLMVSVSGIRGIVGNGLDPEIIIKYAAAYSDLFGKGIIVVGRDSRITGKMISNILTGTLSAKGNDLIDIGICPTPTVLFNVKKHKAIGGIMISASHNPNEWNALKLINGDGEFMTPEQNKELMKLIDKTKNNYEKWDSIGKIFYAEDGITNHTNSVLSIPYLKQDELRKRNFKVVLDCVNGAGYRVMPHLLNELGCEVIKVNCEEDGIFPRLPEPIPENLTATMKRVKDENADLGIVVDPDVDRLVLITDKGEPFGEENTITSVVDFILSKQKGNVVVNLSTTRSIDDVAAKYNADVFRSPVGEANVVKLMKETQAVIGGEGSGGVIYPHSVFGRDALTGTVLFLQYLLESKISMSELKNTLPQYFIKKGKIELSGIDGNKVLDKLKSRYSSEKINTSDGLRIDFDDHWVHFRLSNTEPILRYICEANGEAKAKRLLNKYYEEIRNLI